MSDNFLILLVDDDHTLVDILAYAAKETFPEARFLQVHTSSQLERYFQQLSGYGPRLILLDLDLNESKDGVDILASLRYDDQTSRLPVIILTSRDSDTNVVDTTMLGAASYSTKPADLQGWKQYLSTLSLYWKHTVRSVPVWFTNET
ncbi:response regulator [Spirosoma sp. KNUC1025]|uniref:response regulator n=1 Tax=Spirosoma sp. KNUC1025 TaxID=2894082 RepID=UPI001E34F673|nr:response regulator [Spirosoma sp. KNUC1025]UFH57647.1 response regulator [Spirosoma sp. KNUC1025]